MSGGGYIPESGGGYAPCWNYREDLIIPLRDPWYFDDVHERWGTGAPAYPAGAGDVWQSWNGATLLFDPRIPTSGTVMTLQWQGAKTSTGDLVGWHIDMANNLTMGTDFGVIGLQITGMAPDGSGESSEIFLTHGARFNNITDGSFYIYGGDATGDVSYYYANDVDTYPYFLLTGNAGAALYLTASNSFVVYDATTDVLTIDYDSGHTLLSTLTTGSNLKVSWDTTTSTDNLVGIEIDAASNLTMGVDKGMYGLKITAIAPNGSGESSEIYLTNGARFDNIIDGTFNIYGGDATLDDIVIYANDIDPYPNILMEGDVGIELQIATAANIVFDEAGTDFATWNYSGSTLITDTVTGIGWDIGWATTTTTGNVIAMDIDANANLTMGTDKGATALKLSVIAPDGTGDSYLLDFYAATTQVAFFDHLGNLHFKNDLGCYFGDNDEAGIYWNSSESQLHFDPGTGETISFAYAAGASTIFGADSTTEDLILRANDVDTYASIMLYGNEGIEARVATGEAFIIYDATNYMVYLDYNSGHFLYSTTITGSNLKVSWDTTTSSDLYPSNLVGIDIDAFNNLTMGTDKGVTALQTNAIAPNGTGTSYQIDCYNDAAQVFYIKHDGDVGIFGDVTVTLGATETFLIDGATNVRTGTNPILDINADINTTVAGNNVAVIDVVVERQDGDTGDTYTMQVELVTSSTSAMAMYGHKVFMDASFVPSNVDADGVCYLAEMKPARFGTAASINGLYGFKTVFDSANLTTDSGNVYGIFNELTHSDTAQSIDRMVGLVNIFDVDASTTVDNDLVGYDNEYSQLDGTITGTVYGFLNYITNSSTGTAANFYGTKQTLNLSGMTIGTSVYGDWIDMGGTIQAGQTWYGSYANYDDIVCGVGESFYAFDIRFDGATTGGTIYGINISFPDTSIGMNLDATNMATGHALRIVGDSDVLTTGALIEVFGGTAQNKSWFKIIENANDAEGVQVIIDGDNVAGSPVTPSLRIGSAEQGIYPIAAGSLGLAFTGALAWSLAATGIEASNAAGPAILNEAASSTNPTLIPNKADPDSGYSWNGAGELSIVPGGIEGIRIVEDTKVYTEFYGGTWENNSAGADDYEVNASVTLNDTVGFAGTETYSLYRCNLTITDISGWQNVYLINLKTDNATKFSVDSGGAVGFTGPATFTLGATDEVLIDARTTPRTDNTAGTGALDINLTTSTNSGIAAVSVDVITHDLANTEWAHGIHFTHNSSACTQATANYAAIYGATPTADPQCNDYFIYINAGYDTGIYTGSDIEFAASLTDGTATWDGTAQTLAGFASYENIVLASGANTFSLAVGTASLDIAPGATLNIDANLQVTAVCVLDQDLQQSASPQWVSATFMHGAANPVTHNARATPHTGTAGVIDIDLTTSTNDGISAINIDVITHDLANTHWAYGIYMSMDNTACTNPTSNTALIFMANHTADGEVNEYGIYIGTGYDNGIYSASDIEFIASLTDGTATWDGTAQTLAGFASISSTILTDGTFSVTGGAFTVVTSIDNGTTGVIISDVLGIDSTPDIDFDVYCNRTYTSTASQNAGFYAGESTVTLGANASFHGFYASPAITEAATGTHVTIAGVYVNNFTVTDGSGTEAVTNLAGIYIAGAPVAGTAPANGPYAIFVDSGECRFDGTINFFASLTDGTATWDGTAQTLAGFASYENIVLASGADTFSLTVITASLDIAAGAALDIDASLQVTAVCLIDQDLQQSATPVLGGLTITNGWVLSAVSLLANDAAGPALLDEAATSTNPTLIPNRADPDSGWGWAAADQISAVVGGLEAMRIIEVGTVARIEIGTIVGSGDANYALHIGTAVSGGGWRITNTGGHNNIVLQRNTVSAADQLISSWAFNAQDDATNDTTYVSYDALIVDDTNGSETGKLRWRTIGDGTLRDGRETLYTGVAGSTFAVLTIINTNALITLTANTSYNIKVEVIGVKTDHTETAGYHFRAIYKREGAGAVLVDKIKEGGKDDINWDCELVINGNNVEVHADNNGDTVDWEVEISYIEVT